MANGLLAGIMNPAVADPVGGFQMGEQKRQQRIANEQVGAILQETIGGKLGALGQLDQQLALGLAKDFRIPIGQKDRLDSMVGDVRATAAILREAGPEAASQFLGEKIALLDSLGIDAPQYFEMAQRLQAGDMTAAEELLTLDGALASLTAKPKEFKQGTGAMAGYSFDPTTGEYSIDPALKAELDADKESKADKNRLTAKDVAGVNDKVTALTKDVRGIVASAKSLDNLKARGSAASKLAAVFKFMKTLDPTSVVRESEQGQVYAAQGAAASLAGQLNQLLGEGALTEQGFQDVVDTAKNLANSAVEASENEVSSYLDVLSDKLTVGDFNKLRARVPQRFEIGGSVGNVSTTITTQEQYDALAPGTVYTGADGKQYRKP